MGAEGHGDVAEPLAIQLDAEEQPISRISLVRSGDIDDCEMSFGAELYKDLHEGLDRGEGVQVFFSIV